MSAVEVALGVHFPVARLVKALGLEDARGITDITIHASNAKIVTVTLTKEMRTDELEDVIKAVETGEPTIETINVILKG